MGLDGVLVVAIEQAVAAPFCTQRLADAGARVIKVERTEGDFARRYDRVAKGESSYFAWLNHGKQSLALDIKAKADADLLHRLIARADVFVQNLAPGAAARAGFDSDTLRGQHPRLVTCDISGYGNTGPARDLKAYDLLIQCETGLASISGAPDNPSRIGVSVADIACGMNAAAAIVQALYERERTGAGRAISISLFDSLAEWMAVPLLHHDYGGSAPEPIGLHHPSIAPYGAFACRGGKTIIVAVQNEREWRTFCQDVLFEPGWISRDAFRDNDARVANRAMLDREIASRVQSLDHDEMTRRLARAEIAFGAVNSVAEFSVHPQLRRRTVHTANGEIAIPVSALDLGEGGSDRPSIVPHVDQHGEAIRQEFA